MTRPIVVVDLLFFTGTKGGMETYAREVYARLDRNDPAVEYVGFCSSELFQAGADWFPGQLIDSGISGESRIAWAAGEVFVVQRAAKRIGATLIHVPANFGPTGRGVATVVTVHDLLAFRFPQYLPGAYGAVLRWLIRRSARSAREVLTVSEASARDIRSFLGVADVAVVPLAGSYPIVRAVTRREDLLLAVGNRMPHKNFERLLEAMALLPLGDRPRLIITGSHGADPLAAIVERLGLTQAVTLMGWLSHDELSNLYATASALVFPTSFEGFGLPVLEAMSAGCPVICTDLPVLREVAGDAAYYCDSASAAGIESAISTVLADAGLRSKLAAAGRERASAFSWERTAQATRTTLLRAVAGGSAE